MTKQIKIFTSTKSDVLQKDVNEFLMSDYSPNPYATKIIFSESGENFTVIIEYLSDKKQVILDTETVIELAKKVIELSQDLTLSAASQWDFIVKRAEKILIYES